jgi:hypothetical protein
LWVIDDLIMSNGKVFVPAESPALSGHLAHAHGCGHEVTEKTLHKLCADFQVPSAHAAVRNFMRACTTYQRNKIDQLQPADLVQPLPVPSMVWADIGIDFIEGLLQPLQIASLDVKGCWKLGSKFLGPFQVMEKIDDVAYRQ